DAAEADGDADAEIAGAIAKAALRDPERVAAEVELHAVAAAIAVERGDAPFDCHTFVIAIAVVARVVAPFDAAVGAAGCLIAMTRVRECGRSDGGDERSRRGHS